MKKDSTKQPNYLTKNLLWSFGKKGLVQRRCVAEQRPLPWWANPPPPTPSPPPPTPSTTPNHLPPPHPFHYIFTPYLATFLSVDPPQPPPPPPLLLPLLSTLHPPTPPSLSSSPSMSSRHDDLQQPRLVPLRRSGEGVG